MHDEVLNTKKIRIICGNKQCQALTELPIIQIKKAENTVLEIMKKCRESTQQARINWKISMI